MSLLFTSASSNIQGSSSGSSSSSLLLNGIENDIRELIKIISSNRKLSVIRDSSERVLLRLSRDNLAQAILNAPSYNLNQQRYLHQKNHQQIENSHANDNSSATKSSQDEESNNQLSSVIAEILIPYLLACNNRSANSKILIHSIGSIQRILGANSLGPALRENEREGIMKALSAIQSRCDEDSTLDFKVIQTIPLILSSPHPITESLMKQSLEICFLYSVPRTVTSSNKSVADNSNLSPNSSTASEGYGPSLLSKAESLIKKNWSSFTNGSSPAPSEPVFDIEVAHTSAATLNQSISLLFSRVDRDFSQYLANNNNPESKSKSNFSTIEYATACSTLREICKACDIVNTHSQIRARRFSSGSKTTSNDVPVESSSSVVSTMSIESSSTTNSQDQNAVLNQQSNNSNHNWFAPGMVELPLGLEIIEMILSTNRHLFLHSELQSTAGDIVKTNVCNLIVDILDGKVRIVFTWPTVVRLMRTIIVLICDMKSLVSSVTVMPLQHIGWTNTSPLNPAPFTTYVMESLLKTMETANTSSTVVVTPLWHRALILETLHSLCMTPGFLRSIFDENPKESNDSLAISLYQKLVQVLTQFITKTMATNEAGAISVDLAAKKIHSYSKSTHIRGLDMLAEVEPPISITIASVILTATECLVSIADILAASQADNSHMFHPGESSEPYSKNMDKKYEPNAEKKGSVIPSSPSVIFQIGPLRKPSRLLSVGRMSPSYSHEGDMDEENMLENNNSRGFDSPMNEDLEVRSKINVAMLNVSWKPILTTFSLLLQTSNEESMIQFLLRAYMSLTTTCGVLGLNGPRDEFLSSLCSFALPPHGISPFSTVHNHPHSAPSGPQNSNYLLTPKNLQILKALFNIAHGLGSILGTSWYIILETFEQLDYIVFMNSQKRNLKHNITGIEGGMSSSNSSASLSSFSILSSNNIFRTSEELSDEIISSELNNSAKFQVASMTDDDERVVVDLLRSLFESTRYLTDAAVKNVVIALSQLCFTTLAHMSTRGSLNTNSGLAISSSSKQNLSTKLAAVVENSPRHSEPSVMNETMSEPSVNASFDDYQNYGDEEDDEIDLELIEASMNSQHPQSNNAITSESIKKALKVSANWTKQSLPKISQFKKKTQTTLDSLNTSNKSDKNQYKTLDNSFNSTNYGGTKRRSLIQNVYSSVDDRDSFAHRLTYRTPPFALEKLVETTMKNLFRLNEIWDVTSQALISVASVGDSKIRMYVCN